MLVSEPSRQAFKTANREARRLGQPAVGTGHLLLALLRDEVCAASGLLRGAGVEATGLLPSPDPQVHDLATEELVGTRDALRTVAIDERRIDDLVRSGRVVRLPHDPDRLPQTAALKRAIERAIEEARQVGPSGEPLGRAGVADVGTEHVLLGLLVCGGGAARKVLERVGVDAVRVREQIRLTPHELSRTSSPVASPFAESKPDSLGGLVYEGRDDLGPDDPE